MRGMRIAPRPSLILLAFVIALSVFTATPAAQAPRITSPKEEFGFNFGDDYQLATYEQLAAYWQKLDRESDRMVLQEIGKTSEGRPHLMATVTSPENHKNLTRYREISRRLALAEGLTDEQAQALAREGKAIVWIDGGLHASEVLGAQQLGEMVYQMVSRTDEETMRFLNDTVILLVHANPDGHDLVADWYMRNPVPEKRSPAGLPLLYHHYIGHDNNRDFFASTQKETENINRVLYHEWSPQILYNHHQSGPAGTVFWSPPFRDPFNYNQDPLLVLGLQQLGLAIHSRMAAEGKPGASARAAGAYDGWWNGGIRNTAAFHNVLAILTEMIGTPTPMRIPFVLQRQLPTSDLTFPITPRVWHFRESIEYSITANRAILDHASRWRETLLLNVYRMGRNSIERGSKDTWTPAPHRYAAIAEKLGVPLTGGGGGAAAAKTAERDQALMAALRSPEYRDPRGYIVPANQADFPTAVKFINALREVGISVHRATRDFEVHGKTYAAGSFVVMTAQAFRPHVIDMFEPQDHPDNIPFPGAPPTPPYDHAGWTLAFQMGIEFDRVLDAFTGPFEPVTDWNVKPPPATVSSVARTAGYLISHQLVDSFAALNRLLAAGEEAYWLQNQLAANGKTHPAGTWYVPARSTDSRCVGEDRRRVRRGRRRDERAHSGHGAKTAPSARRLVGSVRRLDGLRLGEMDSRAVSILVREGLSANDRRRQSQREVRRARLCRGWHSSSGRGARRRAACARGHSGTVSPDARANDGGAIDSSHPPVRGERRHRNHDWRLVYESRRSSRAARRGSPGGGRQAAAGLEVLHPGFDSHRAHRRDTSRGARFERADGHLLRHQSRVPALRDGCESGRQEAGVVRYRIAAQERLVMGPAISAERRRRHRCTAGEGASAPLRSGNHQARAAARDVQVPVQRYFLFDRDQLTPDGSLAACRSIDHRRSG